MIANKKRLRDMVVVRERGKIRKKIKEGTYMSEMREKYGILNENEFISDKSFLSEMVTAIENDRARRMVYDKNYQRIDLDDWIRLRDKKERNKRIKEKIAAKKKSAGA